MIQTASTLPPTAVSSRLRLELMSESSRTEAMRIWRELESDLQSTRLMCSSIWTETWLRHYGNLIPHHFIVASRTEVPCGICLLTRGVAERNGPWRMRTLHVGTAGESEADSTCVEYNALLVRPDERRNFQQAVWNWVLTDTEWDEFRLDGFCEAELAGWPTANQHWSIGSKPARYYDLAAARAQNAETLSKLGPQTRAVIRQNLRRCGPVTCEWAETTAEAEQIFDEQIGLHQIRWNAVGLPGCYASRLFREFHRELLHKLHPAGLMGLFRVRNSQRTLGCAQVLIDNNRACIYQGGRLLLDDRRVSIGVIVDYLLIEECRRRGLSAVDYLAGDSAHKRRLSTSSAPLNWAVCRRPSLKHRLIDGLRSVKRTFQRASPRPTLSLRATADQLKSSDDLDS